MVGMVLIELRRSSLAYGTLGLAAAQVWMMLNDAAAWRGVWPMASAAVSAPWLFLGPIAAGLSAFDALRRTRRRADDVWVGGRIWRSETTAMLLARVIFVCSVVLVGAVCAVLVNLVADAPVGFLWPSYLLVTLAFAVECVVLGMLLGSLGGPLWFSPVLVVLVTFLRGAWFQGASVGSPESAFTRLFLSGRPWVELDGYAVICALVEAAVVIALALTLPRFLARWRARRTGRVYPLAARDCLGALASVMALIVTAGVVVTSPSMAHDRRPPAIPLCSTTELRVCVWPENALLLPPLEDVATRASRVADEVGGSLMPQINEFGLAPGDNFLAMGQGTWFFSDTLAGAIASSLAPVQCSPAPDDPTQAEYYGAQYDLSALFQIQIENRPRPVGYGDSSGVDIEEVTRIWQALPAERNLWIDERVATMATVSQGWCA